LRIKAATIAAAVLLAALLVNHWWVGVVTARIVAAAGGPPGRPPVDFGVELPGYVKFLVKLDHFAVDFGYVLIPFAWVVAFLVASIGIGLIDFFGRPKAVTPPADWPVDP
jgi:hypothetical protein